MKGIHRPHPLHLLLAFLLFGSAACGSMGGRPSPATTTAQSQRALTLATRIAQTLQATRQAGEVATAAAAQARQDRIVSAQRWPVLLADSFDEPGLGWPTGTETDPLADIEWSMNGGRYRWEATAHDSFVWWTTPEMENVGDFHLAASVQQVSGPAEGEAGLVFRIDSETNRYYLFEIDNAGRFALFFHDADTWETLIDWQVSPALQAGSTNRLGVIAQGEEFILLANDQPVATWQDDRLGSGQVGLLIGLSEVDSQGTWEFDNFEVRGPADINFGN